VIGELVDGLDKVWSCHGPSPRQWRFADAGNLLPCRRYAGGRDLSDRDRDIAVSDTQAQHRDDVEAGVE
jgi:hypothetical protein